jgi:hypothetical protein
VPVRLGHRRRLTSSVFVGGLQPPAPGRAADTAGADAGTGTWRGRRHGTAHDATPALLPLPPPTRPQADEQRLAAGGGARLGGLHLRRVDRGRVAQLAFGLGLLQGFEDV